MPGASDVLVLIIDDSRTLRRTVSDVLAAATIEVRAVTDPESARRAIDQRRPDAIVLDLGLARHNGEDLVPWLAAVAPVVILSAHGDRARRVLGRYAALDKTPEDIARLPAVIAAAVDSRSLWPENTKPPSS